MPVVAASGLVGFTISGISILAARCGRPVFFFTGGLAPNTANKTLKLTN